jgi:hypothetical protein
MGRVGGGCARDGRDLAAPADDRSGRDVDVGGRRRVPRAVGTRYDNEGVLLEVRMETARRIVDALRAEVAERPGQHSGNRALLAKAVERQGCVRLEQGLLGRRGARLSAGKVYTLRKELLRAEYHFRRNAHGGSRRARSASATWPMNGVALHAAEERWVVAQGRLEEILATDGQNMAAQILHAEVLDRMVG